MMHDYVTSKKGRVLRELGDLAYSSLSVVVFICKTINIAGQIYGESRKRCNNTHGDALVSIYSVNVMTIKNGEYINLF